MSVIRWDPFGDVDALFDRVLGHRMGRWPRMGLEGNGGRELKWAPSTNISESEKEYVIRAELPAVKKEDVQVTLDDGVITIKGERKQEQEDHTEKYHRVESMYGSFERSFALPDNVNADGISCDSHDGVLSVHLPKAQAPKQKPKQIAVQ